jgi:hypothetical protein
MCIKINKIDKQEIGIWWVQKRYPQYGIPIWSLWPKIRFLPSTVTEKNILDGRKDGRTDRRTDRRTEVKQDTPSPFGERGHKEIFIQIHGVQTAKIFNVNVTLLKCWYVITFCYDILNVPNSIIIFCDILFSLFLEPFHCSKDKLFCNAYG